MNWIRIATGIADDPRVAEFAEALDVDLDKALGKFVRVLCRLPEHARDGNLTSVAPGALESWANWRGKKGRFDAAFRRIFCDEPGFVRTWEKHNGAAIREADAARERMRNLRNKGRTQPALLAERSANVPQTFASDGTGRDGKTKAGTSRILGSSQGPTPENSPPVAVADGKPPSNPGADVSAADRFIAVFYGAASDKRRADVRKQLAKLLQPSGVAYRGEPVRAFDAPHLAECISAVIAAPPRDANAAITWLFLKLRETYADASAAHWKRESERPVDPKVSALLVGIGDG